MQLSHSISNRPLIKVIAFLGLIIIGFWLASYFPDLVLTLIISTLIAFVLRPIVRFLEFRLGLRRSIAIAIVFFLVGGIIVFTLMEMIPLVMARITQMYAQLRIFPFEEKLTVAVKELTTQVPFINPSTVGEKVHGFIQQLLQSIGEWTGTAASYLVNLAIIPFITFFILAEGDIAIKKLIERIPNKYFEMILNVMYKLEIELVSYLRGLILECGIVGGLSVVGFMIIGIPYAVLIGVLTGIANLVPYLGPIIGASFALLASLTKTGDFSMFSTNYCAVRYYTIDRRSSIATVVFR